MYLRNLRAGCIAAVSAAAPLRLWGGDVVEVEMDDAGRFRVSATGSGGAGGGLGMAGARSQLLGGGVVAVSRARYS